MPRDSIAGPSGGLRLSVPDGTIETVNTWRVSPVLVGRADQLAAFDEALAAVRQGSPATLLIGGEAGVGKSRLIGEFAARGSAHGRVLTGGCLELGASGLPFAPFTAVLRQLVRELGVTGIAELLSGGASRELGRLLPELGEPAGHEDEAYQGEARARLFEQILALFERLAQLSPLTLIIEDAHWADRSTRDLLTFLIGNQLVLQRVLIVVTYRSDELHRTHPLRPLLAELGRISWVDRSELPRLSKDEAAAQIAAILAEEPKPSMVDVVFRRSEGNPLFVEHLIGCDSEVPESLRDMVLAGVNRLPEETRDLLRVASAAGTWVGHRLLAEISGLDDEELSRVLRPAVAGNVLLTDSEGYQFRHALIREVMHDDLLPGEHSRLHASYAEAISADPTLVPAGRAAIELAHHWHSAHDVTWALISAWQAAAEAGRALAYSEQLGMLSRVLELWDKVPDAAQRIGVDHVGVLEEAVQVTHFTGDAERGMAFTAAALQELDRQAEPARAARLIDRRVHLGVMLDQCEGAAAELHEALQLVSDGLHERERAQILASLAQVQCKLRDGLTQARAAAEEALAIARRHDDVATQAKALLGLATLELDLPASEDDSLELLTRARAAAEQVRDYHLMLTAAINESHVLEGMGRHLRAAEVAGNGLAEAEKYGLSRSSGAILAVNVAEPLIAAGRWDEAGDVIARALGAPSNGEHRSLLWQQAGEHALLRGDLGAANDALSRATDLLARTSYQAQSHLPYFRLQIDLLAAEGHLAAALAVAHNAIAQCDVQESPRYAWPLVASAARVVADVVCLPSAVGDDAAAGLTDAVLQALRAESAKLEVNGPVQSAFRLTFQAEIARADRAIGGQLETVHAHPAVKFWQAAADAWDALGQPYQLSAALYRIAEASLADHHDRREAAQALKRAAELAEDLGALRLVEEIMALARRARISLARERTHDVIPAAPALEPAPGPPREPAAASPPQSAPPQLARPASLGLTPREFEVLRLVAAGRSNAAIAAELFISTKTVSVHVSNILAKLGAGSRGEAAALAHRLRLFDPGQPVVPG
jgi:predicted ATPase/DNA-binding NarL/FixJ family response regulator